MCFFITCDKVRAEVDALQIHLSIRVKYIVDAAELVFADHERNQVF